jgi:hypothetical protein
MLLLQPFGIAAFFGLVAAIMYANGRKLWWAALLSAPVFGLLHYWGGP